MSALAKLGRRTLLRVMTLGVPGLLLGFDRGDASRQTLTAAALQLIPNRSSAEAIARAYLRANPREAQRARAGNLASTLPRATRVEAQVIALRRQVRDDFRNGDVVWVRGFLLARSEARLCAWLAFG